MQTFCQLEAIARVPADLATRRPHTCAMLERARAIDAEGYLKPRYTTVPQGSVTVNGISLTVADSQPNQFSVAIIPYTWEFTNMKHINVGDVVNLEFDIIGKYISKLMQKQNVIK